MKTHGIKGEVKVTSLTDIPGRYIHLEKVYIHTRSGKRIERSIKNVREIKGGFIVAFISIMLVAEAEELVGGYITVPACEVPELGKDTYYHFEIIDMDVYTDEGRHLGRIEDIFSTGSNDVYIVKDNEKEYLIPAIHDVIKEVDKQGKRMVIHSKCVAMF